jgi:hypothetical protein
MIESSHTEQHKSRIAANKNQIYGFWTTGRKGNESREGERKKG